MTHNSLCICRSDYTVNSTSNIIALLFSLSLIRIFILKQLVTNVRYETYCNNRNIYNRNRLQDTQINKQQKKQTVTYDVITKRFISINSCRYSLNFFFLFLFSQQGVSNSWVCASPIFRYSTLLPVFMTLSATSVPLTSMEHQAVTCPRSLLVGVSTAKKGRICPIPHQLSGTGLEFTTKIFPMTVSSLQVISLTMVIPCFDTFFVCFRFVAVIRVYRDKWPLILLGHSQGHYVMMFFLTKFRFAFL